MLALGIAGDVSVAQPSACRCLGSQFRTIWCSNGTDLGRGRELEVWCGSHPKECRALLQQGTMETLRLHPAQLQGDKGSSAIPEINWDPACPRHQCCLLSSGMFVTAPKSSTKAGNGICLIWLEDKEIPGLGIFFLVNPGIWTGRLWER